MDITRLKARRGYTITFNCAVEDYNNTERQLASAIIRGDQEAINNLREVKEVNLKRLALVSVPKSLRGKK